MDAELMNAVFKHAFDLPLTPAQDAALQRARAARLLHVEQCTRCRERPRRSPTQRWCRECHTAYMRAARARG